MTAFANSCNNSHACIFNLLFPVLVYEWNTSINDCFRLLGFFSRNHFLEGGFTLHWGGIWFSVEWGFILRGRVPHWGQLNFRRPQSRKLFSGRFINAVHLAHAPITAEQNDMQRALYPLSVLAAPSTDRQTLILLNGFSNQERNYRRNQCYRNQDYWASS